MDVLAGSTDLTTYFKLRLAADGTAATGLTIADLDLQYVRSGVAPVAKVDAVALAATDTAHTDSRAIEIDATDQPGLYRVDWPDAAFAAGVREVILTVKHATIFTEDLRVNLTPVPANVTQLLGTAWLAPGTAGTPDVNAKLISGDATAADNAEAFFDGTGYAGTGNVIPTVTTLTGHTAQTGDVYAIANSGTFGNSALKTLIDTLDNLVDTEVAAIQTDLDDIQARLPAALVSGRMDSNVQAAANGVITAAVIADGAFDRATFAADTGLQTVRSGTAQAGSGSQNLILDSGASAVNDFYNGCRVYLTGGVGAGQARFISDYTGSTKTADVTPAWTTTPDVTSTFAILPAAAVDVALWAGTAAATASSGYPDINVRQWQTGTPADLVFQMVQVSVAANQADVITAASIATGAIDADALAADAVTEIQSGLATAAALDAVDNFIDTEILALITTLGTPAGASISADLLVIDNFVDDLESRLTATRAGYLDNLSAGAAALEATAQTILADTNELQVDWVNGGRLDLLIDAILADTDSLDTTKITTARAAVLTDWIDGGRLDLILDARASQASVDTVAGYLDTEVAAILAAVDTEVAAIQTAVVTTIPATLSGLFTTALTESYSVDGSAPTVAQALMLTMQALTEGAIVSTSWTIYKLNGSTPAAVVALNSATVPTSKTRSS